MPTRRWLLALGLLILVPGILVLAQDSREVHKSGRLDKDARVLVDTYKGSVEVTSWDKPEIDIQAEIVADGNGRGSRESVRETEIRIDMSPTSVRIKTDYERVRRSRNGFFGIFSDDSDNLPLVHYKISVPRSVRLEVKDYKSRTEVEGLQSSLVIESYKGDITVGRHEGSLTLETYKGKARVDFRAVRGRARVQTYKGELELNLPRSEGFDLDLDIGRSAKVRSDFELNRDRYQSRKRGYDVRVAINGGGSVVQVKCDKGSVRLFER